MLKSNIDVFFVTSFLRSLKFLFFHRIQYPKRCLWKQLKFFYGSVFVIWLYRQKSMYHPCDLDHWPMKVIFFQWIEYNPISIRVGKRSVRIVQFILGITSVREFCDLSVLLGLYILSMSLMYRGDRSCSALYVWICILYCILYCTGNQYTFQIDISSNSREIKYQNIGRTHRQWSGYAVQWAHVFISKRGRFGIVQIDYSARARPP